MCLLDQLSFGGLAAEEELNLAEYFVETPEFRSVARGRRMLVLGEKGSGKTAIARYLSLRPSSSGRASVTVDLSPDLYLWTSVSKWAEEGVPSNAARKLAWKLTFLQYLGHYLLANAPDLSSTPEFLQRVKAFLFESGLYVGDPTWWERPKEWGASLSTFWDGARVSLERLATREPARRSVLAAKMEATKVPVAALLNSLSSTLVVVIDRLDELWDDTPQTRETLVALLLAAREMNTISPRLEVVVLLRTDIYRELVFADKDKLSGSMVEIRWNPDKLRNLLNRRVQISLELGDKQEALYEVFAPTLVTETGLQRDTISFMLSIVRSRPRDLLIYAEKSRDAALRNNHNLILGEDILEAEAEFSRTKRDNLCAEFAPIFPEIIEAIECLTGRPQIMSRRALVDALGGFLGRQSMKATDVIRQLLQFEVLGIRVKDKTYYYGERPSIETMIESSETRFVVAPALRAALNCTRGSRPSDSEV